MAYRLKDYLYNDKLTKEQNILMDRLYKLRMSGMAEAFVKDGILAEDGVCDNCGYILPEGTELEEVE